MRTSVTRTKLQIDTAVDLPILAFVLVALVTAMVAPAGAAEPRLTIDKSTRDGEWVRLAVRLTADEKTDFTFSTKDVFVETNDGSRVTDWGWGGGSVLPDDPLQSVVFPRGRITSAKGCSIKSEGRVGGVWTNHLAGEACTAIIDVPFSAGDMQEGALYFRVRPDSHVVRLTLGSLTAVAPSVSVKSDGK